MGLGDGSVWFGLCWVWWDVAIFVFLSTVPPPLSCAGWGWGGGASFLRILSSILYWIILNYANNYNAHAGEFFFSSFLLRCDPIDASAAADALRAVS